MTLTLTDNRQKWRFLALPKCHYCGVRSQEVAPLRYQRHDGVNGMSYPICAHCANEQGWRLERSGFTLVYGMTTGDGRLFVWPLGEGER